MKILGELNWKHCEWHELFKEISQRDFTNNQQLHVQKENCRTTIILNSRISSILSSRVVD